VKDTDVQARTSANRRLLADFFDGLTEEQLNAQSLCQAWTVREVLAHLAMPLTIGLGHLIARIMRARGSVDTASEGIASELAGRPIQALTGVLREHAAIGCRLRGSGRWAR
jgi:hypothetical protein